MWKGRRRYNLWNGSVRCGAVRCVRALTVVSVSSKRVGERASEPKQSSRNGNNNNYNNNNYYYSCHYYYSCNNNNSSNNNFYCCCCYYSKNTPCGRAWCLGTPAPWG